MVSARETESASWRRIFPPPSHAGLHVDEIATLVRAALGEDLGCGDRTSETVLDAHATASASLLLKEPGIVCGLDVACAAFLALDPEARFEPVVADGACIETVPCELARVEGRARALLAAERTALNFVGRLSGIATLTRRYVDAIAGTRAVILDTRKTTPGLRHLEKYAVRVGGGRNHRVGLDGAVLIKDNHLRLAGSLAEAVANARRSGLPVEVECETLAQVQEALDAGADAVLLDNMPPALLREAVTLARGRAALEASGRVTLDTVRDIAETGVDFVSAGSLTHSARSLDVSLEVL
jgi:nicotinate-nucleotide pyrophosphorylase (carboxylating)